MKKNLILATALLIAACGAWCWLCGPLFAQYSNSPTNRDPLQYSNSPTNRIWSIDTNSPKILTFANSGETLFSIKDDGTFVFGEHVTPNAAAREFASMVETYLRRDKESYCKTQSVPRLNVEVK